LPISSTDPNSKPKRDKPTSNLKEGKCPNLGLSAPKKQEIKADINYFQLEFE
jgi:hypothetical protein